MAYTPTVWQAGDTITAAKLNKIEEGLAAGADAGAFIINISYDDQTGLYTTDKTFGQLKAAILAGKSIINVAETSSDSVSGGEEEK